MHTIFAVALMIFGTLCLLKGADWFTDGAGDLAKAIGVSALFIGIVLAGLEPEEMLTAAIASGRGAGDLALGNVVGTNITIITLALGLAILLTPITLAKQTRTQAIIATAASLPPIVLLFWGSLSRVAGFLLLLLFAGYTWLLFHFDRPALEQREVMEQWEKSSEQHVDAAGPKTYTPEEQRRYIRKKSVFVILGLALMALGGPSLVEGALELTRNFGVSQSAVGLTIVSLGTGAEMIALAIAATRRRATDILVGGILGSFAYNLLVTLGLAALIHPLQVPAQISVVALPIMIAAHLVLLGFFWYGRIPRVIGALYLLTYVGYIALLLH